MKKLLIIFLLGQLLLLSYIFNKSIYAIYEINNLGDTTLNSYIPDDVSGDTLSRLYDQLTKSCLEGKECTLQVIKNPVSENENLIYDIYHSDIDSIEEIEAISARKEFNYYQLKKEDFVDNDGVFYSDITETQINELEKELGIKIDSYDNPIDYRQIVLYNSLNFIILLLVTQLVLFIYTFTRIRVNTVKKVLGFTTAKMVMDSLKGFLYIEFAAAIVTFLLHFIFYYVSNEIVTRYFVLLFAFLIIVIAINVLMLFITQVSLKFIDINLMIKNKTYSSRLNFSLYTIKIILILTITLSMSILINNYQDYRAKTENLKVYEKLSKYYTSIGYNAIQDQIAKNNPDILKRYGESIKDLYQYFDQKGSLLTHDVKANISYIEATFIDESQKPEDFYHNINLNYIIVNKKYLAKFDEIHNLQLESIKFNSDVPTILVPSKYKDRESEIQDVYVEKYNTFLTYNTFYDLETNNDPIDKVNILFIENNVEHELLGKNVTSVGDIEVKDPIVIIDTGTFDTLYYYDQLNQGDLVFQLENRDQFTDMVQKYGLSDLVIGGTLITPFLTSIHSSEFVLYNSLVFTLLFLFTLLFFIYISNYVDIVSNSKKYAVLYVHGYSTFSIFKSQLILLLGLLSAILISLITEFNILFYIVVLVTDLIVLLILYNKLIKRNIQSVLKGG
jgi:putative ABC transport system permease protein